MEDALVHMLHDILNTYYPVLILVLMEDALVHLAVMGNREQAVQS